MPLKLKVEGFGFIPSESQHHFLVTIPQATKSDVVISEHFDWDDSAPRRELSFALGREDSKLKVILRRSQWNAIADELRAEFNRRLKQNGMKSGQWKVGQIPVSRLLGKEMVVLAWAIEDADPTLISVAIKNWRGLAPEERWWLFTICNAATGHAMTGKNKGWRKAIRYALTENPVSDDVYAPKQLEFFFLKSEEVLGSCRSDKREKIQAEEEKEDDRED